MFKHGYVSAYTILALLFTLLWQVSTKSSGATAALQASQPVAACAWQELPRANEVREAVELDSLAATSSTDVWAAGSALSGGGLIKHWDGTSWQTVPSAAGGNYDAFTGLAALSPTDAWAVGYAQAPTTAITEHWDGITWQRVPVPHYEGSKLLKVSGVSDNDVWAVGHYITQTMYARNLIVHWNGNNWSEVASPNYDPNPPYNGNNQLRDVVALAPDNAWAVGQYIQQSVILHWNGSEWAQVPSPTIGVYTRTDFLRGISAVNADDIWAVGEYWDANNYSRPLVIHWDGTRWQLMPEPPLPGGDYEVSGVSALSADEVWLVGNTTNYPRNFSARWDGTSWHIPTHPPVGIGYSPLLAVEAVSQSDVWAVGTYDILTGTVGLIEHYSCTEQPPTPSASPTASLTRVVPTATASVTPTRPPSSTPTASLMPSSTATPQPNATPTSQPPTTTPSSTATSSPSATATACALSFTDVPSGHTFAADITYLACNGIVNGYPNGNGTYRFMPNQSTTRGEFAKIVKRGFGLPSYTPAAPTFSDVPASHVFYPFIEAAAHTGVVSGYGDGTYRPGQFINRGEVAKIVKQAANFASYTPTAPTFSDVPADHFAYVAVETLYQHAVISGGPCGTLRCYRPEAAISRGELSKVVHKVIAVAQ